MIALALLALLASLAAPSFGGATERARLRYAAETLAADIADARLEAARRGQALHLDTQTGAAWCWAIASQPGCGCAGARSCQLKYETAADHGGIRLLQAAPARLEASGETQAQPVTAIFESARGERLEVWMSPLGRSRICSPAGTVPGYPAC